MAVRNSAALKQRIMTSRTVFLFLLAATCLVTGKGDQPAVCDAGFEAGDGGCVDVDECKGSPKPCHALASCANSEGSFSCACSAGYIGNGTYCTDGSWAVRTYVIWPDGEYIFQKSWDEIKLICANIVTNGENIETPVSKRVASSSSKISRHHGEYGSLEAMHAIYGTEEEARAAFANLKQFGLTELEGLLQPFMLTEEKVTVLYPEVKEWFSSARGEIHVEGGALGLKVDNIEFNPG